MKLVSAIFYPEPRLILSKDSESRGQGQTKTEVSNLTIPNLLFLYNDKTSKNRDQFFEMLFCCYKLICIFAIVIGLFHCYEFYKIG